MSNHDMPIDCCSLLEHAEGVRKLARSLLADAHDAEDVSQETLLLALRASSPRTTLGAWLNGVVHNLARGLVRRRRRRGERERSVARPESQPSTLAALERVSEQRRVLDAVLDLDEPYRTTIVLRYFVDLDVRHIAERLNVPVETVRTRLKRALARLRTRLREEHGGDATAHCAALLSLLVVESRIPLKAVGGGLLMATNVKAAIAAVSLIIGSISILVWSSRERPASSAIEAEATKLHVDRNASAPTSMNPTSDASKGADAQAPGIGDTPAPAQHESFTIGDLRAMLRSSRRSDQVRAIDLLVAQATPDAVRALLDAFLTSSDPILIALVEEALLKSSLDLAPELLKALSDPASAETLGRLVKMLTQLATTRPDLEQMVVQRLIESFNDLSWGEDRETAVVDALVSLGIAALDPLTRYVSDSHSDPRGVGMAAVALSRLDAAHAGAVRSALGEALNAMKGVLDDPAAGAEAKDAARQKTGSVAWAAANRPAEEHDLLARDWVERFTQSTDAAEAGTLGWGLATLNGLSDPARLQTVRSILSALPDQPDSARRRTYVWAVSQLVSAHYDGHHELDASFRDIVGVAQDEWNRYQNDPQLASHLQWLLTDLRAHEKGN